tara:strand:+ start:362 stop:919 length:558 start_codon:yes stop_codon:yes gene_type:complete
MSAPLNMGSERRMVVTTRACEGRLVPAGDPVSVPKDAFVTLTQSEGGNFTIIHQGNMVRIDGIDADVIGLPPLEIMFEEPGDSQIHETQVWEALQTVFDPEIPVSLPDLGLVYGVDIDQHDQRVDIQMTLTAPGCGFGQVLIGDVEARVGLVPNVSEVQVELVFDPPWSRDMMTDEARLATGLFD